MELTFVAFLALLQGFTEFLPISSSAHLLLPSMLLGWPEQGLVFDVAMHLGTLIAVILYFKKDLKLMIQDSLKYLSGNPITENSKMTWFLIIGTVPAVLFGGLLTVTGWDDKVRSIEVIITTTLLFGFLLGWIDYRARLNKDINQLSIKHVILIGMAQAVALLPGTSRSGITLTAGLWLGFTRSAAARFSFLLSIPVIIMAGAMKTLQLIIHPITIDFTLLFTAIAISAISAYLCIHWFLSLIEKVGLMPFVIYRILLGIFLAYYFL